MPVFAVMLRGENFVIEFDGKPMRCGFYATRFVRSRNAEEAELAAVDMVRRDEDLLRTVRKDANVKPMLFA